MGHHHRPARPSTARPAHRRAGPSRTSLAAGAGALVLAVAGGVVVAGAGSASAAATAVPLGTAGQFAVLAGSGITNTGATTIIGDTGSSPTASATGFVACPGAADCVSQTGTHHAAPDPNDAVTVQAKTALTTAYDNAAGQGPTTQVATELGGQTLVAGVYGSASGTFGMTDTLVLDGANDPSSVFIFQTSSTLITAGTGNVSLIRGASACNIFWQVGSAATLGAGSTLRGTVLAHDDISLGDSVTVEGRLLGGEQASGTGAVTLIHDTITTPTCTTPTTTTTAPTTTTATTTTAAPTTTTSGSPGAPGTTTTAPGAGAPSTTTSAGPGGPTGPGSPGSPGTPGGPGTPVTPGSPGSPAAPGTPGSPAAPGAPGAPGSPGTPGGPGTPGTPGAPGTPGTPGASTGTGSGLGTQVRQVPVGGVDTGDGSTS